MSNNINVQSFINLFSEEVQNVIAIHVTKSLQSQGFEGEELKTNLEIAMNSRLCDLSELIDITTLLDELHVNRLHKACEFLQWNDKNGEYDSLWNSFVNGELSLNDLYNQLHDCLVYELNDTPKDDIEWTERFNKWIDYIKE